MTAVALLHILQHSDAEVACMLDRAPQDGRTFLHFGLLHRAQDLLMVHSQTNRIVRIRNLGFKLRSTVRCLSAAAITPGMRWRMMKYLSSLTSTMSRPTSALHAGPWSRAGGRPSTFHNAHRPTLYPACHASQRPHWSRRIIRTFLKALNTFGVRHYDGRRLHSVLSVDYETPCSNTIRRPLLQLTDIQRQAQRKEWDLFLKNRSKTVANKSANSRNRTTIVDGAAQLLRLGIDRVGSVWSDRLSSSKDQIEFDRLGRNRIPLVYRSKA